MRLIIVLVTSLTFFSSFAQYGSVTGRLIDKNSQLPISFCNIVLSTANDSAVNGTFSGEDGKFQLNQLKYGKYYLLIQSVTHEHYKTDQFELSPNKPTQHFEDIELVQTSIQTEDVTISLKRTAVKIEPAKKTFDVQATGADAGGTAVDVLNTLPSVDVDDNGNISLRGNSNIRILIDGIPAGLTESDISTVINQLPANSVETIEVITVPSAKYDPEGIGGIINIVLKKEKKKGFKGGVNISYSDRDKINARLGLSLTRKKISLNTSYSYVDGTYWYTRTSDGYFSLPDSFIVFDNERLGVRRQPSHNGNMKFSYTPNKSTKILLDATFNYMNKVRSDSSEFFWNYNNQFQEKNSRYSINNGFRFSQGLQMNAVSNFKKGKTLSLLSRLNTVNYPQYGYFSETYTQQRENKLFGAQAFINQLDFTYKIKEARNDTLLGRFAQLETGLKSANRIFREDFTFFEFDPSLVEYIEDANFSNNLNYGEDVYAGYSLFNWGNKKKALSTGIRGEYSNIVSETDSNNYNKSFFNFFPSFSFVRNFSDKKTLTLSYSKRIKRPRGKQLNPIPSYSDPYNLRIGNADIVPEKSHMSEISYLNITEKNVFNSTLFYQFRDDRLGRLSFTDSAGISTVLWINFNYHQTLGLELFNRYTLNKKFSASGSSTFYHTWVDGENFREGYAVSYFGFDLKANLQYTPNKKTTVTWTGDFNSRRVAVVGIVLPRGGSDISLKYKILKNKGVFTIRLTDLFRTRWFAIDVNTDGWLRDVRYRYESQLLWIGFNYNFGQTTYNPKKKFRRVSPNDRTF